MDGIGWIGNTSWEDCADDASSSATKGVNVGLRDVPRSLMFYSSWRYDRDGTELPAQIFDLEDSRVIRSLIHTVVIVPY